MQRTNDAVEEKAGQGDEWLMLAVTVIEARGLGTGRVTGVLSPTSIQQRVSRIRIDPYVRLHCRNEKHRTSVKKKTNHPEWDEHFLFGEAEELLGDEVLHVTVKDKDVFGAGVLGTCEINLSQVSIDKSQTSWFPLATQDSLEAAKIKLRLAWKLEMVKDHKGALEQTSKVDNTIQVSSGNELQNPPPGDTALYLLDFTIIDGNIEMLKDIEDIVCTLRCNNQVYQTRRIRGTQTPVFHENFILGKQRALHGHEQVVIHVKARQRKRKKLVTVTIGYVTVQLQNELYAQQASDFGIPPTRFPITNINPANHVPLQVEPMPPVEKGYLQVCYNCHVSSYQGITLPVKQNAKCLTVRVIAGRHLKKSDLGGKSDPYCLVRCKQQVFRTKVKKQTLNPHWNETFVFGGKTASFPVFLHDTLLVEIRDKDLVSSEYLGSVTIPLDQVPSVRGPPTWHQVLESWDSGNHVQGKGEILLGLEWSNQSLLETSETSKEPQGTISETGDTLISNGLQSSDPEQDYHKVSLIDTFTQMKCDQEEQFINNSTNNENLHASINALPNRQPQRTYKQPIGYSELGTNMFAHIQFCRLQDVNLPESVRLVQLKSLRLQCVLESKQDNSSFTTSIASSTGSHGNYTWGSRSSSSASFVFQCGSNSDSWHIRLQGTGEFGTPLQLGSTVLPLDKLRESSSEGYIQLQCPIHTAVGHNVTGVLHVRVKPLVIPGLSSTVSSSSNLDTSSQLPQRSSPRHGGEDRDFRNSSYYASQSLDSVSSLVRVLIQQSSLDQNNKLDLARLFNKFKGPNTEHLNREQFTKLLEHIGVGSYYLEQQAGALILNSLGSKEQVTCRETSFEAQEHLLNNTMIDIGTFCNFALGRLDTSTREEPVTYLPKPEQVASKFQLKFAPEMASSQAQQVVPRDPRDEKYPSSANSGGALGENLFEVVYANLEGQESKQGAAKLLDNGANVDWKHPVGGWEALHMAAGDGNVPVVCWLVQNGADVGARDEFGKLPEDYAKECGQLELADLLCRYRLGLHRDPTIVSFHPDVNSDDENIAQKKLLEATNKQWQEKYNQLEKLYLSSLKKIKSRKEQYVALKQKMKHMKCKSGVSNSDKQSTASSTDSSSFNDVPSVVGSVVQSGNVEKPGTDSDDMSLPSYYIYQPEFLENTTGSISSRRNSSASQHNRAARMTTIHNNRRSSAPTLSVTKPRQKPITTSPIQQRRSSLKHMARRSSSRKESCVVS